MAQIKLLKIDTDGVPVEFNSAADEITLASFTIQGGGPVLSSTGLDLNNQDVSDVSDLAFNDPSVGTINQTAGALIVDNLMAKERENTMTTGGAVAFPVITNVAGEVDAFRLPALAGVPSATPTNGGEGHLVWDSTGERLFAYDGSAWKDLSVVTEAGKVCNEYTAGEDISAAEAVYISAADTVSLASAAAAGPQSRLIGFAGAGALDTETVKICSEGVLSGFSGLTAGSPYFLSATAGAITATRPSGAGNTIVLAGYAKSATQLHAQIQQLGRLAS